MPLKAGKKGKKTTLLQEDEGHIFSKTFRSHIIEIVHSKKKSLEGFKGKILTFKKTFYLTKIDRKVEGDTIRRQNQVIETKTKMFDFNATRVQVPKSRNV